MTRKYLPIARRLVASLTLVAALASPAGAAPQRGGVVVDSSLPSFNPRSGGASAKPAEEAGAIRVAGSSTVSSLLADVAEPFRKLYPKVTFDISGGGNDSAANALADGKADIATTSRPLTAQERAAFKKKHGHEPTELVIALDAITVVVPKANPIPSLTIADLAAIFGSGSQGRSTVGTWGELGLTDPKYKDLKIAAYGSREGTGVESLIRAQVLAGGEFRSDLHDQSTQDGVATGVASGRGGIGYVSQFFLTPALRAVPLAAQANDRAVAPSAETVANGSYPLGRRLYAYVNQKPGTALPSHIAQFLTYVYSKEGQQVVVAKGAIPLPANLASTERAKLQ